VQARLVGYRNLTATRVLAIAFPPARVSLLTVPQVSRGLKIPGFGASMFFKKWSWQID
jgi:hypothetical protein